LRLQALHTGTGIAVASQRAGHLPGDKKRRIIHGVFWMRLFDGMSWERFRKNVTCNICILYRRVVDLKDRASTTQGESLLANSRFIP